MSDRTFRPSRHLALLSLVALLLGGCADLPGFAAGDPADTASEAASDPASETASDPASEAASEAASEDGSAAEATRVAVDLDEWSVAAMPETVPAGEVELTASNVGEAPHEMAIVRRSAAGDLPTDEDGAVDEDALDEDAVVGRVERLASGDEGAVTVDLPAGDYVLLCNLVHRDGQIVESHYQFGMASDFTVAAD